MDRIRRRRRHLFAMEGEQLVRRGQTRCALLVRRGFGRWRRHLLVEEERIGAAVELLDSWAALEQRQVEVEAEQEAAKTALPIV